MMSASCALTMCVLPPQWTCADIVLFRATKRIDDTNLIMREIIENPPTSGQCSE